MAETPPQQTGVSRVKAWANWVGTLVGLVITQLIMSVRGAASTFMSVFTMYILHSKYQMGPDIGYDLMRRVTHTFYTPEEEWVAFIAAYLEDMTGESINYNDITSGGPGTSSTFMGEKLGKTFFDKMLNTMLPVLARPGTEIGLRPEDGLEGAHNFLAINLQFQMSSWLLHLYGDWFSFGAFKSLKDLPNAISWSYGIGWLSWLVMGVPFRMGISEPLERYYNARLNPTQLNFSQVMDMWHKELLTDSEVSTKLNELGFAPDLKWRLMAANWKTYSRAEIKDMLLLKQITRTEAIEHLKYNDVKADQAEVITGMWENERSLDITRKIISKAEDLYVKGIIDGGMLKNYLDRDNFSAGEKDLKIMELDLEKMLKVSPDTKTGNLSPANIGALYKSGEYSYVQARDAILQDNFNPDQVDDFLKLYAPAAPKPEVEKEATAGIVARLFIAGQVSEGELRSYLLQVGYSDTAIEYMIRDYKLKIKVPAEKVKVIGLTPSQIGNLFKKEIITGGEAISRLKVQGMVDADIELFLNLYLPPEEPTEEVKVKQLTALSTGRLYKAGEINYNEAILRLMDLGYTQNDSILFLQLYKPEEATS